MARTAFPDGIDATAMQSGGSARVILARFLIFAVVLALALVGLFGGGRVSPRSVETAAVRLSLEAPDRVRNGNHYKVQLKVAARAPIAEPVIAVPAAMWRESTMNSLRPEPEEEAFRDGEYRFRFAPLAPGQSLVFKIDGQINPALYGRHSGNYRLLDGDRELARIESRLTVIP